MLDSLKEINRILLAIKQRTSENTLPSRKDVIEECQNVVLGGRIPNHYDTINFCLKANIIVEESGFLNLTKPGEKLLENNDSNSYELNIKQLEILVNNCFFHGIFEKKTLDFLKQFTEDPRRRTFVFLLNEQTLKIDSIFLSLIKESSLIVEENNFFLVNPKFSEQVAYFIEDEKYITEDQLIEQQKIKKIIGSIGEEIVFQFEKERLLNECGAKPESDMVRLISSTRVNAGYDIDSFDGKNLVLKFDRFIEVKSSTKTKFDIYLSENELKKAEKLKEKYWIYFVGGINRETKTSSENPIMVPYTYKNIFENSDYTVEEKITYHITKECS